MTRPSFALASVFAFALSALPVFSQSTVDINKLVMKSKLVDTGRPVNSNVSGDQATISTFVNPKASDRDCKVTALLMMKEINSHYHNIQRIRVLFFDPVRTDSYRQVDVKQGHVAFVDSGESIDMVLGTIDIEKLTMQRRKKELARRADNSDLTALAALLRKPANMSSSSQINYETYESKDDSVSFLRPKGWLKELAFGASAKFGGLIRGHYGSLIFYKQPMIIAISIDSFVEMHEQQERKSYKNFQRHTLRSQTCAGFPAVYYEASADLPSGQRGTERAIFINAGTNVYWLDMLADSAIDHEMQNIFDTAISSLRIHQ